MYFGAFHVDRVSVTYCCPSRFRVDSDSESTPHNIHNRHDIVPVLDFHKRNQFPNNFQKAAANRVRSCVLLFVVDTYKLWRMKKRKSSTFSFTGTYNVWPISDGNAKSVMRLRLLRVLTLSSYRNTEPGEIIRSGISNPLVFAFPMLCAEYGQSVSGAGLHHGACLHSEGVCPKTFHKCWNWAYTVCSYKWQRKYARFAFSFELFRSLCVHKSETRSHLLL